MFVYRYVFFCFNHYGTPTGSWPKNFVKIRLGLAEIIGDLKMFVCWFVCLFVYRLFDFCFNQSGTPTESSPENFINILLDLAEIFRI